MPSHQRNLSGSAAAPPSTATGSYRTGQAPASLGPSSGALRVTTAGSGQPSTDAGYQSGGGQSAPQAASGLGGSGAPYEVPRKGSAYNRPSEELHMPSSASSTHPSAIYQQQQYPSSAEYGSLNDSNVHSQPASLGSTRTPSSGHLPGSLQPGHPGRPGAASSTASPSTVPTMPQSSTQQYASTSRSGTASQSQYPSRSSPAGLDGEQQYHSYGSTPDASSKHGAPPIQKYTPIQNQGATSNSPLGLADIRPRADSDMSEDLLNANPYSYDGALSTPSNSNYQAPWALYAFDWCKWSVTQPSGSGAGKVAVGSYLEDGHNFIQILDTQIVPQAPSDPSSPGATSHGIEFIKMAEATHSYPVTRILWEPPSSQKMSTDLLATSGDHLRLWSLPANAVSPVVSSSITRPTNSRDPAPYKLTPLALLSNSKSPEHTAPLTSLDWNTLSPSLIITSSIDTTCTIWDIPTLTAKTQLIAHDKEVFDVRFCANSVDVFVSCGADGSVRMFDLRSLEHSTIIYEPTDKSDPKSESGAGRMSPTTAQQTMSYAPPLLRLSASPHDAHLLATFSQDSNLIRILDVRQPGQALLELRGHSAPINCIEWSPTRRGMLASGADDSLVLVWDLLNANSTSVGAPGGSNGAQPGQTGVGPDIGRGPTASWRCDYEVGNLSWAPQSALTSHGGDWLGVTGGRGLWGVKL